MLRETPLSVDQQLKPLADSDWLRLRASVPDDQETLGWVFGLGEKARVLAPGEWTEDIQAKVRTMSGMYEESG